jgi:low affinity Fe/Cu permease
LPTLAVTALSVMHRYFAQFATVIARATGSPYAFLICAVGVVAWALSGPLFHYSQNWQLLINTATTIVTFLMVFLIQNSQNRDGVALQTKLDELIRSSSAQNAFIGIEKLSDQELDALHERCVTAAEHSQRLLDKAKAEREARKKRVTQKAS